MVKFTGFSVDQVKKEQTGGLFADSKSDVSASMEVEGLMEGYKIGWGSSVITAAGELAFLTSSGTWNWV